MHFKIATRSSPLALWQTDFVAQLLQQKGHTTEYVRFETKGDKVLDTTLSKIGSKGLFTEELEQSLFQNEAQLAVHSAKDLPSTLPEGLEIIAFTPREQVHDVLVSFKKDISLATPNVVVGTSSTRRVAVLKHFYPSVTTVDMRGNLQTRMKKLQEGACDAIILAYAGVHRMNFEDFIVQHLPVEIFTPPVGQGTIAIEISSSLDAETKKLLKETLNHPSTETCLLAERSYLKQLNGGCSIPSFAYASYTPKNELFIRGGIFSLDGKKLVQDVKTVPVSEAEKAGEILAKQLLAMGGAELLEDIKKVLH